jgi:hypothetical protein
MEPRQLSTAKETFDAMAVQFDFDPRIAQAILDHGVTDLETFSWLFTKPEEVGPALVDQFKDVDKPLAQVAKVRRAWAACKAYVSSREASRSKAATEDLDEVLAGKDLADLKNAFFRRYRMTYPPDLLPSDRLVSRLYREIQKRCLTMKDVLTVFTLFQQKTQSPKRQRVADGLYVGVDSEDVARRQKTYSDYLDALYIYCLALAMAGCSATDPAPAAPEVLGVDTCDYVAVPLDVVMRYWFRCKRTAMSVVEPQRYIHLLTLDEAERAEWVSRFCQGTDSLGKVIDQVYRERDAHWTVFRPAMQEASRPAPSVSSTASRSSKGRWEHSLRDGTVLCQDYQTGQCSTSGKGCSKGEHRCGVLMKSGRVCGSRAHTGSQCDAKGRA